MLIIKNLHGIKDLEVSFFSTVSKKYGRPLLRVEDTAVRVSMRKRTLDHYIDNTIAYHDHFFRLLTI